MPDNPKKIPFISRRFGDSHAVWFAASKLFVLLEEPAWKVFKRFVRGETSPAIGKYISELYGAEAGEAKKFTADIIREIRKYNSPAHNPYRPPGLPSGPGNTPVKIYSRKNYRMGKRFFSFIYGNKLIEQTFHPILAHLEAQGSDRADGRFELVKGRRLLHFRYNGKLREAFRTKDIAYFKGAVFQQLHSVMYGIGYDRWMMTLHASGVSDGRSAILFSAESGKGKSTLAALLQAHGFGVVADDFIPVSKKTGEAFSIPVSLSAKEGSWETLQPFYPQLTEIEAVTSHKGIPVRYLPPEARHSREPLSYPVKAVIFVRYDKTESLLFTKMDHKEALREILAETWVYPSSGNIRQFFRWMHRTPFYRMVYSDNLKAIETIQAIFKGEQ